VKGDTQKILVVDNEIKIRQLLAKRLTILGYKVFLASNGKEALQNFTNKQPDLIVLDIILSKLDGYEVCRRIRMNSHVPIIILTALDSISDRVMALEIGADDYIIKPFSLNEFEARIRSLLRRSSLTFQTLPNKKRKRLQIGNLYVDMNTKTISKNNLRIKLTILEYSILELLIENAGKKLSRLTILNNIWGYTPERYVDNRIVDVHISRLRLKIEDNPSNPDIILTVRGFGYMLQRH